MNKNTRTLIIISLFLLIACGNNSKQLDIIDEINDTTNELEQEIETSDAIKIQNHCIVPKESFKYNSMGNYSNDTLILVTCANFVYFPFGKLKNKSDLKDSRLNNFKIIDRFDEMPNGKFEFQILTLNTSKLILFFSNATEGPISSYIFKGEINDSEVNFINGVKIGMSKEDFLNIFFDVFPNELMEKYKYIVFESCVQDIIHTYSFENNKLKSINFITDSYWNVDY